MDSRYVEVQGLKTRYIEQGKGEVILFLHGWMGSSIDFPTLFPLAAQNFKAIALDLPGFGETPPFSGETDFNHYAEFAHEFLTTLGIDKCLVIGNCFGGTIGLLLAQKSAKVDRLALFTPITRPDHLRFFVRLTVGLFRLPFLFSLSARLLKNSLFMRLLLFIFFGRRPARYNEAALLKKQQANPETAWQTARQMCSRPLAVEKIQNPVLLLTFSGDIFVSEENIIRSFLTFAPRGETHRISRGHLANPDELLADYQVILRFLKN